MNGPASGSRDCNSVRAAVVWLLVLVSIAVTSGVVGWLSQTAFGRVSVQNVRFTNPFDTAIRAKLLQHKEIHAGNSAPGVVVVHGYQNNRETSDPFCIELACRGIVVLCIDAIGRGNSDFPEEMGTDRFDGAFGGSAALEFLRELPTVDPTRVGLVGNSIGAEIVYNIALEDPRVSALAITGFAFDERATREAPKNMLMIFGAWDEYRERMIGGNDLEGWLESETVARVVGKKEIALGETVGRFDEGTARQIWIPRNTHLGVTHSTEPVARIVVWMRRVLNPDPTLWISSWDQLWPLKEWASLIAMVTGLFAVLPMAGLFLSIGFFRSVVNPIPVQIQQKSGQIRRHLLTNACLMCLYFPLVLVAFGIHLFVVPIDHVFPMMMANGILFWFFASNLIGFVLFERWRRRSGLLLFRLGLSTSASDGFALLGAYVGKTVLLAVLLFSVVYGLAYFIETTWMVDYRFLFPFASDLTLARAGVALRYLPFVLVGSLQTSIFLNLQMRNDRADATNGFFKESAKGILVMIAPLISMLLVQYVPFLLFDVLPFVGPGGGLVSFAINLFHIIGVLLLACPIFVGLYRLTGRPYLGAVVNALIITWMFASSQVVAPIPL